MKDCWKPVTAYSCGKVFELTGLNFLVSEEFCKRCIERRIRAMCMQVLKIERKTGKLTDGQADLLKELEKEFVGTTRKIEPAPAPYKRLSIADMGLHFVSAALRFAQSGFKLVSKETFIERMMCCTTCSPTGRCPYCGCFLKLKDRMASEGGCPTPKTYPHLTSFPPKNYWAVCDEMTSVIIPSRNEVHLNKTIENILKTVTGKIEVLVGLDGWDFGYDVMKDNRIKVIKEYPSIGRRRMSNKLANMAQGKYLHKVDAHSIFKTEGWDTKLKCVCEPDTVVGCVMDGIDEETWQSQGNRWLGWIIDLETGKWDWQLKMISQLIELVGSFHAASYMMQKETFIARGMHDETLSGWNDEELEWTLKIQRTGGRIIVRTDVECAHLFRKERPYELKGETDNKKQLLILNGFKKGIKTF